MNVKKKIVQTHVYVLELTKEEAWDLECMASEVKTGNGVIWSSYKEFAEKLDSALTEARNHE